MNELRQQETWLLNTLRMENNLVDTDFALRNEMSSDFPVRGARYSTLASYIIEVTADVIIRSQASSYLMNIYRIVVHPAIACFSECIYILLTHTEYRHVLNEKGGSPN